MLNHKQIVFASVLLSALSLLTVNSVALNANTEANKNPVAMNLYREIAALPEGTKVAVANVGWFGFTFRYVQAAERPDLVRVSDESGDAYELP